MSVPLPSLIVPAAIVTGSVNVAVSIVTVPVPLAASPIVIELKPSDRLLISVSVRFSVPVPPPSPMVVVVFSGLIVKAAAPLTPAPMCIESVLKFTAPLPPET